MQPARSDTILRIVDSAAIVLCHACHLARIRLASAASPVLRLMMEWDQFVNESNCSAGNWLCCVSNGMD